MRIRIVSDLHVDVNQTNDFGFLSQDQDLLLIAGDVAGSCKREWEFLHNLKGNVACVAGNHLGYDYRNVLLFNRMLGINSPLEETREVSIRTLQKLDIHYLEKNYFKCDNYIVFGGTMFTDFRLYGDDCIDICKRASESYLNDYRLVHTYEKKNKLVRPITANDQEKWHKSFIRALKKCLKETTEDVIVLTHHCPSIKCISKKYLNVLPRHDDPGYYLNASYASDLEKFILDNPRIKLWACGHCHDSKDFKIGGCRVVMEPFGYSYENELSSEKYMGKVINIQ